ncbi:MAG TPA: UDP-N-acetylmuramoyl-tripeptide--D-alanyl-D-alanine ligase [Amoebophilaceae bacterium]|jgi:UDP-N-acetylmuramoyl-tripeptide--D-alanyl-D-alanine ligase|nr:UDP-N-acetylmuramoyl-tripeptide--D-alanyl-D-alanine ligase [Amoebophilaceae bacterium]
MLDIEKLYQMYATAGSVSIDSRTIAPGALFFAIHGANFNGNLFAAEALAKGARYAIVDDPTYATAPACMLVEDSRQALETLAHYHRTRYRGAVPVIGVTGSYGKTTTKELLYSALSTTYRTIATKGNLNTSIGVALTLLSIHTDTQIAVVEMGATESGDIARCCQLAAPTHGIITAIGEAHLDGFGTLQGVLQEKSVLYDYLYQTQGTLFLNSLEPLLQEVGKRFKRPITYPQSTDCFPLAVVAEDPYLWCKTPTGIPFKTHLMGAPHRNNIAAALCVAHHFQVPLEAACRAVQAYVPAHRRMEFVQKGNHQLIIDSYNASPASVQAALGVLLQLNVRHRIVVLGDMAELGERTDFWHAQMVAQLHDPRYDVVLLCGPAYARAVQQQPHPKIHCFSDKAALSHYLEQCRFEPSGWLFKGSHGLQMHTLAKGI